VVVALPEAQTVLERVNTYYRETWFDYRAVWLHQEDVAFHFGYWQKGVRTHRAALLNANRVLADIARVQPGDRVLDAGCAHGGSSLWLAEQRAAEVVGITVVPGQARAARSLAATRGLDSRVTFEVRDYTQTGLEPGSLDVVWALESLCHAAQKRLFYREAARLLRPGGRLVVADYMRTARPLAASDERIVHEWLDGWAIHDIDTPDEHLAHAAAAGLTATWRDGTSWTRPSLRRLHRLSLLAWGPDRLLHRVRARTPVQHGNVVASRRQYQALCRGAWVYGVLSAEKPA
jgi:cyclopropane fatty-acyl-phospholipid synthase-like methyltransferase